MHCIYYIQFLGFDGLEEINFMVHNKYDSELLMDFGVYPFIA